MVQEKHVREMQSICHCFQYNILIIILANKLQNSNPESYRQGKPLETRLAIWVGPTMESTDIGVCCCGDGGFWYW